jgi:sarcosine oxidase subunit gamma
MARKGASQKVIGEAVGVVPPSGPEAVFGKQLSLIGIGPGVWLAFAEQSDGDWCPHLTQSLEGQASVSDQSSGYVILRLSGSGARTVLQRGASIDLAPAIFQPGASAATMISHMSVWIWQVDDRPTYDVAIFRSFADSFRHWLNAAVAAL